MFPFYLALSPSFFIASVLTREKKAGNPINTVQIYKVIVRVALSGSGLPERRGAGVSLVTTGRLGFSRRFLFSRRVSRYPKKTAMAYGRVRVCVLFVIGLSLSAEAADIHYGEFEVSCSFNVLISNRVSLALRHNCLQKDEGEKYKITTCS